jgi:ABC-type sugar transport system permease subunit
MASVDSVAAPTPRPPKRRDPRRTAGGYLYVLPALCVFGVFIAFPVGFAGWLSLRTWDGFTTLGDSTFVGADNYSNAFSDPVFRQAATHTVMFTVVSTVVQMVIAFFLAYALWYYRLRFANVLRALYFFPAVLSMVVVGLAWRQMLSADGPVNQLLEYAGLPEGSWLGGQNVVMWVIIWIDSWQWTGWTMILYLAGMVMISRETIEAAQLDGASSSRIMRSVVFPQLASVTSLAVLLNVAGGFQVFDTVYVMTGGGPSHASEVLGSYAYWTAFASNGPGQLGYAATIAVMMVAVLFVFSFLRIRASRLV